MDTETGNEIKQNTLDLLSAALTENSIAKHNVDLAALELSKAQEGYELALQEAKEKQLLVKAAYKQNNKAHQHVDGFIRI